jgi:2-oxoglutarate ferredoxin oxidoreductase subunit delta
MAKVKGDIVINVERCKGCEVCIAACPFSVIAMTKEVNGKGYHYAIKVNNDCTGCMNCAVVCPDGVITVYRAKVTTE